MSIHNPLNAYRQTRVKTAGQGTLIVMLYDEAIKQMDLARDELRKGKQGKLDMIHNAIVKTQDVITELIVSLDFDKGGEIAQNLFSLYMYFNQQLMQANLEKKEDKLLEVRKHMAELREAWQQISKSNETGKDKKISGGVNIAG